jgi:hypothetical protein
LLFATLLVFQCYAANSPKYQNKKALEDSVAWLRRHDPDLKGVDLTLAAALANLAGTPLPGFF